jgi:uncharacterized protein (DUF433 family)
MAMSSQCDYLSLVHDALNEASGRQLSAEEFAAIATSEMAARYLAQGLPGFRGDLPEWSYQATFHERWPTVLVRHWLPRFRASVERTFGPAHIGFVTWIDDPGDQAAAILKAACEAFILRMPRLNSAPGVAHTPVAIEPDKALPYQSESRAMATLVSERLDEPWRRRLLLPAYQIAEAAEYARISPQTVVAWHKIEAALLKQREQRSALSYMQLIEVAVVAAFRKARVPMPRIRKARAWAAHELKSEYPFAEYKFKENAKHLYLDSQQIDLKEDTVVQADAGGQLEWASVIGRLNEFQYEDDGIVLQWHVAGKNSPIIIDPRISFGSPAIKGTPTWVIKGRHDAGESERDIAADFDIALSDVRHALRFEGITPRGRRKLGLH